MIATPVAAGGPSTTAEPDRATYYGDEIPFRDLVMDYTVPQDFTGHPSAVVSAGSDTDKIPVGLQMTSASFHEEVALRAAAGLEAILDRTLDWPGGL